MSDAEVSNRYVSNKHQHFVIESFHTEDLAKTGVDAQHGALLVYPSELGEPNNAIVYNPTTNFYKTDRWGEYFVHGESQRQIAFVFRKLPPGEYSVFPSRKEDDISAYLEHGRKFVTIRAREIGELYWRTEPFGLLPLPPEAPYDRRYTKHLYYINHILGIQFTDPTGAVVVEASERQEGYSILLDPYIYNAHPHVRRYQFKHDQKTYARITAYKMPKEKRFALTSPKRYFAVFPSLQPGIYRLDNNSGIASLHESLNISVEEGMVGVFDWTKTY